MEKRKRQKWSRETRGCVQFGIGRPNEDQRHSLLYAICRSEPVAADGGGWIGKGVVDSRPHRAPHLAFREKKCLDRSIRTATG